MAPNLNEGVLLGDPSVQVVGHLVLWLMRANGYTPAAGTDRMDAPGTERHG